MILSKQDLRYYIAQDQKSLRLKKRKFDWLLNLIIPKRIPSFQRTLRIAEYYNNKANKNKLYKLPALYYKLLHRKKSLKLGFTIPLNVFGPGLSIAHYGTIVVNPASRIGANCRIHVCVNIGASNGSSKAPIIGDNVYIAPGCKIFGDIEIASNVVISANSVVNRSFKKSNVLVGGVPAKVLKEYDELDFSWKKS